MNKVQKFFSGWMGIDRMLVDYNVNDIKDISPDAFFGDYTLSGRLLTTAFENPALLKVIALQCDLFSLGEIYIYQNGKEQPNDPLLKTFANPNPFQTQSQWLWDFMFWNMLGNSYCYVDSDDPAKDGNKLYFLNRERIIWPKDFSRTADKMVFSSAMQNSYMNTPIQYKYSDGSAVSFKLAKLTIMADLTNGTGNWFKGQNRLKALRKIIGNSEAALDSKNINIRYAGKYMIAGQADPNSVTDLPMSEPEKQDIEQKMNGNKKVHAFKSMLDVKRFVDDLTKLALDDAYLSDYFLIGNMYNIPKDVLEAGLKGATYENQEKATMRHVAYTLQPKGNEFMLALANRFGYTAKGKKIVIDWSHLPFMQVFEKDKAQTELYKAQTFQLLLNAKVALPEINKYLDLDFKTGEANAQAINTSGQDQQTGSSQTN